MTGLCMTALFHVVSFVIVSTFAKTLPLRIGCISSNIHSDSEERGLHKAFHEGVHFVNCELRLLPRIKLLYEWIRVPFSSVKTVNFADDVVALLGHVSVMKNPVLLAHSNFRPIITYGYIKDWSTDKHTLGTSSIHLGFNPIQVVEPIMTFMQYHNVKKFTLMVEDSYAWKNAARLLESLASSQNMTIEYLKFLPKCQPKYVTCDGLRKVISKTLARTETYVFLGEIEEMIHFLETLEEFEVLESRTILGADLQWFDAKNRTPQCLRIPSGLTLTLIVPERYDVDSDTFGFRKSNGSKHPAVEGSLMSAAERKVYEGVVLYGRALKHVLHEFNATSDEEILRLARNGSLITRAILSLEINSKRVLDVNFSAYQIRQPHENDSSRVMNNENVNRSAFGCPVSLVKPVGHYRKDSKGQLLFDALTSLDKDSHFAERKLGVAPSYCYVPEWSVASWMATLAYVLMASFSTLLLLVIPLVVSRHRATVKRIEIRDLLASGSFRSNRCPNKGGHFQSSHALDYLCCLTRVGHVNVVPLNPEAFRFTPASHLLKCENQRSLSEIMCDQRFKLDPVVRDSLIKDLVRALLRLQSLGLCHGNLKSSNCLVSSRWQLKLSDTKSNWNTRVSCYEETSDAEFYQDLLWKAPELLRNSQLINGTVKADVYAFGLIVHELVYRRGLFDLWTGGHEPTVTEIRAVVEQIRRGRSLHGDRVRRPLVERGPSYLEDCWHEVPEQRPDFVALHHLLNAKEDSTLALTDGTRNVVDYMFHTAKNLVREAVETESEIVDLQQKVSDGETALYQLLPKYAAESLMMKFRVEPKTMPSAAVLFGRILNFEELAANSSPEELYELVRDVSNRLDFAIGDFRVRKLEAVNEDYFVASWPDLFPESDANHTKEMALVALNLKSQFENYGVALQASSAQLTLRFSIGLHVGPAVAGVIGLCRPHYHLFGTTVNMASRLSTTGEPGKIHMSEECYQILNQSDEFAAERRGKVQLKGIGEMVTYWLNGVKSSEL